MRPGNHKQGEYQAFTFRRDFRLSESDIDGALNNIVMALKRSWLVKHRREVVVRLRIGSKSRTAIPDQIEDQ
jgi:hypothetical protein